MDNIKDNIISDIAMLLEEPERNFTRHPLNQSELMAAIEIFTYEAKKPHISQDLVTYYYECLKFLKGKILYN